MSYTRYDTRDGLAASNVYCITQDRNGHIWFGTESGISRFDGTHFRNFTTADGLMGNEVFTVFTDSRNRVWLICFDKEICYYYGGKIYNRQNNPMLARIRPRGIVNAIVENDSGDILIDDPYEIFVVRDTAVTVIDYVMAHQPSNNRVTDFNAVRGVGSILVSIANIPAAIRRHAGSASSSTNAPLRTENPVDPQDSYYICYRPFVETPSKGIRLFSEKDTLGKMIAAPGKTTAFVTVSGPVHAFLRTNNGVTLYDVARRQKIGDYLTDYVIQYVMEDAERNLWFATKGAGVIKMGPAIFRNYMFGNTGVRCIQDSPGGLLVGTDNSDLWTLPAIKDIADEAAVTARLVKPGISVFGIIRSAGNAYINCAGADFLHMEKPLQLRAAKSLHINQDTVLAATSINCVRINLHTGCIIDTLYTGRTTCAYYYRGKYYIGTLVGMVEALPGKPGIVLGDRYPVFKCQINQVLAGNDGILWVATDRSGVVGYKDGRIVAAIGSGNGLNSNLCRCLYVQGNTIWAGTDKGLNRISCSNGEYSVTQKLTSADGLIADMINTVYSDGTFVYAGTPVGLTVFDATKIPRQAACKLVLDDIIVSGKPLSLLQKDTVLNNRDNNIRFNYSGISFLSGGNIHYRYRLLGLREQWGITKENHLDYPSLPSGNYKLQLQAINKFGNKSELLEYSFEIEKKIMERGWIQVLVLLLFIALVSWVARFIAKRSQRKEQEKNQAERRLIELEQMALRAQMNPHFIFNCLNSMQHYIVSRDIKSANFYLACFARLVRQTLDNSSRVSITIGEEISYLKNYLELERLQVSGSFNYNIEASGLIDRQKVLIPNMVLQPYVENAIKHGMSKMGGEGLISIKFRLPEPHILECIIEDNGPGIDADKRTAPPSDQKQPHGMSITDKRIRTLNQLNPQHPPIVLHVENRQLPEGKLTGTRVTICFPV